MSIPNDNHHSPGGALHLPWMDTKQKQAELYRGAFCALVAIGVPMNLHGFDYLLTAIMLSADDPSYVQNVTTRLYPEIEEYYGAGRGTVERDIRTAIENTFLNKDINTLHDYFGGLIDEKSGKVKNSKFIGKVAADVRIDVMSYCLDDTRKQVLNELGINSELPEENDGNESESD